MLDLWPNLVQPSCMNACQLDHAIKSMRQLQVSCARISVDVMQTWHCLYVVKNPCSYLWVCSVCHVYTQELRDQAILSLHAELKCSVAFTIIYMYIFSSRVYYNYSMCIYAPRTLVHWMLSLPLVVRASTVRTVTATSTAMFSHTGATGCFLGWLQNKQCVRVGSAVALK